FFGEVLRGGIDAFACEVQVAEGFGFQADEELVRACRAALRPHAGHLLDDLEGGVDIERVDVVDAGVGVIDDGEVLGLCVGGVDVDAAAARGGENGDGNIAVLRRVGVDKVAAGVAAKEADLRA